jgi:hypothetical protein
MGGIIVKLTGSNIPPLYVSMALDVFTIGWFIFVVPETMRRDSSKGVAGGEVKDYQRLPDSEVPEDSVVAIVAQGNIVSDDDNSDAGASGKPSPSPVDPIAEATTPASILHSIFARENMNRTLLILILLILNLVSGGVMFFFVLYTRAHFGWKAYEDGIYSFLSSASKIISLSLVLPAILKWLKGQGVLGYEVWMVRFGLLMYVVALYLYGAVEHGWGFLLGLLLLREQTCWYLSNLSSFLSQSHHSSTLSVRLSRARRCDLWSRHQQPQINKAASSPSSPLSKPRPLSSRRSFSARFTRA